MRKVKISSIILIITMFPLLIPDGIVSMIGIQNNIMLLVRGLDLMFLFFLIFKKKKKVSFPFIVLSAIYLTILFSAYLHGQLISVLSSDFHGLVMCVAFEYWLNNYFIKTIKFLNYTLLCLIIINILIILIFPNGLYDSNYRFTDVTIADHLTYSLNWLFGYKNNQFGIVLPFLAINCIYRLCNFNKFKNTSIIVFILCIFGEFLAQATMSVILITVFTFSVFIIFNKENEVSRFFSRFYNIKTIIIVVFIIVVSLFGVTSNPVIQNVFTQLSLALGKGTSLNGRIAIWMVAIDYIKDSPIIGYGSVSSEMFIEQSGILGGTHAHNFILHILIRGGFICLGEYIVLYWYIIRFLRRNKCLIANIMGLTIGLFFVDGITSICLYYPLFNPIFILTFYAVQFYYKKYYGREIA